MPNRSLDDFVGGGNGAADSSDAGDANAGDADDRDAGTLVTYR